MKKGLLVVFLLAVVLFPVFAADEGLKIGDTTWKFNGEIRFMYTDQTDPNSYAEYGAFNDAGAVNRMYQRYRFGITAEMNEYLSAHYELQVGDEQWGNKNYNEREVNIRTLYAYLKYAPEYVSGLSVKVGLQGYDDIFQNSVWSDEGVGIIANYGIEKFNANVGYLTLRDDDVEYNIVPVDGRVNAADTLFISDFNYKFMDALTVKAAFYYEDFQIRDYRYLDYTSSYFGIGADYLFNENISVGAHYVMNDGQADYTWDVEDTDWDLSGYFIFGYASYTMDKLTVKVNYGYTPYDMEYVTDGPTKVTAWHGSFPMTDYNDGNIYFARGNQWMNAYGLEYFGRGDVCDRMAVTNSYGYWPGLQVISFNVAYDFMYATYGIMTHTYTDDFIISNDKNIGSELDLGLKANVMKGLEFRAVYAMFFAGDYYGDDVEDGHEMSMLLRYIF